MDKGWMSKHLLSKEYEDGVEFFMNFAEKNGIDPDAMSCPCTNCGNLHTFNATIVKAHLSCKGIDLTYRRWYLHGEKLQSNATEKDDFSFGSRDFKSAETVDILHDVYAEDPSNFTKFLEEAEMPLYSGCVRFTKLAATVKLYNLKTRYGWSDNAFTDLLMLIGEMLPNDHILPPSMYEAKKSLSTLGMKYDKIHACKNDCILYRGHHENLVSCPTCGESRWKMGKNEKINAGVPAKVLWYFPPIPRFKRMFLNKKMADDLTWHAQKRIRDGKLRHPADSPSWKIVDEQWPNFGREERNLRLALSADGINPHSLMSSKYSCWPIILVTYNLPPWLCMKRKHMMLTLLVSGPRQPGNDIDIYLAPLIDDLKQLWEEGVGAYDAYREEKFMLKAVLLWTINDFPAYGNLSGCQVKGYYACPICAEQTCARRLKHCRKISYTGHRKFLPDNHPYRRQKKAFDGSAELQPAPVILSGSEVFQRVERLSRVWGKKRQRRQSKGDESRTCWKKKSIFFDLEYWKYLPVRHVLDVMHIEKNVCESLIGTLLNIPGKTKDGVNARLDLVEMGIRNELAPTIEGKRTYLPAACYTLSKEEKRQFCTCLHRLKVPTGYSSNVSSLVSMDDLKLVGLKSHDCHTLMQQLLPIAIRGILPKQVRYGITRLCFFFNVLCCKVIDVSKLDAIEKDITITLCLLEKHFPPSFFDIMVHLTIHLVREVRLCGPVWYRWMYPFERFMRVLKGYVRNRNSPEGCIAECYIAEEALEFCSEYLSNAHTIGIPSKHRHMLLTKPQSGSQVASVGENEWEQTHQYVLTNEDEISPYVDEHFEHIKTCFPKKQKSTKWLQDEHNRSFIPWLRKRVANSYQISDRLKWLARGPSIRVLKYSAYMVNGVTYHTRARDSIRTVQNSGVSLVARTMQVSSAKDKNPIVSDMTYYGVIDEIWELDYNNFRVVMFKCSWVENNNGIRVDELGFTLVNLNRIGFKSEPFILASQAKQVFYVEDPQDSLWSIVLTSPTVAYIDEIDGDDVNDFTIHHGSFSNGMPNTDVDDDPPCIRADCVGTWVDNPNV